MNKIDRFLNALARGRDYTVRQVQHNFGISDVYNAVRKLRLEGFAVYTNQKITDNGEKITVYRLGQASERVARNYARGRTKLALKALYSRAA